MKKGFYSILFLMLFAGFAVEAAAGVPEGYYKNADGKKKSALKLAMKAIVSEAKVLSYGSGAESTWSGFYETDRMENNRVRDRYSYEVFYFGGNVGSAVSGMNIEHSFPKSWWGGSNNQAYKDLFNLMPCEQKINSSKSNYAMGVVSSVSTNNGCTKVGRGETSAGEMCSLWEPADEWKGDFARSYFYMVTTYSNLTWTSAGLDMLENDDWPTLQQWAYKLLLNWSRKDPVDAIEVARNEAVYKIQGNRNPFVDFPNLAEYIWGDSIEYAFSVTGSQTGGGGGTEDGEDVMLLDESFLADLGTFTCVTSAGEPSTMWAANGSYGATANAYSKGKVADDWLISPEVDLANLKNIRLSFEHAAGYHGTNNVREQFQVYVSTDYEGVPSAANWDELDVTFPGAPTSGNFTPYVSVSDYSLNDYAGEKIRLAFRYQSDASHCWAWEMRKLTLQAETDVTGIEVPTEDAPDVMFDLSGRRIERPTHGVYVVRRGSRTSKVYVK